MSIAGYRYRSTVATRFGGFIVPLSAAHRAATGLSAGDEVTVTLELDSAERTVDIPEDLATAMEAAKGTRSTFAALSPSRRAALVAQVESAKATLTRQRRVTSVLEQLLGAE